MHRFITKVGMSLVATFHRTKCVCDTDKMNSNAYCIYGHMYSSI